MQWSLTIAKQPRLNFNRQEQARSDKDLMKRVAEYVLNECLSIFQSDPSKCHSKACHQFRTGVLFIEPVTFMDS